jgi:hypothetical protein
VNGDGGRPALFRISLELISDLFRPSLHDSFVPGCMFTCSGLAEAAVEWGVDLAQCWCVNRRRHWRASRRQSSARQWSCFRRWHSGTRTRRTLTRTVRSGSSTRRACRHYWWKTKSCFRLVQHRCYTALSARQTMMRVLMCVLMRVLMRLVPCHAAIVQHAHHGAGSQAAQPDGG